jgi:hypothetical protein
VRWAPLADISEGSEGPGLETPLVTLSTVRGGDGATSRLQMSLLLGSGRCCTLCIHWALALCRPVPTAQQTLLVPPLGTYTVGNMTNTGA